VKLNPEPPAKGTDTSGRLPETGSTPGPASSRPEVPPFAVPDHTLLRRVGKGSYGEVWLARSGLGTWRAVKIVRRSAFDADRPYEREFAGIQKFEPISRSHESQLNILQVGRVEDGFYYVMELADDMGLGQEIHEGTYTPRDLRSEMHLHGRLPVSDCLRLGLALTTALEHLHKHGLVHRDIKPSNIVFVNGIPKLADIGLVAQAEATLSFVGTEGFIPPEGPGTAPADIYSLGKVLYELSTGHDRHQFPELPTQVGEMADGVQLGELNEVLLKACQRNPAERYQAAAEMHADLALLDSGRSVVRLRGIERRLRFVQRVGAAVTGIAALVALGWWWQARQTNIVRDLAAENSRLLVLEQTSHDQAAKAEQEALAERNRAQQSEQSIQRVLEFLLKRVVAAARPPDEDGEGMGREVTVLQTLGAAEPLIQKTFTGQPLAELRLRQGLATTFKLLGLSQQEIANRHRAVELSEALSGVGSPETLSNRLELAWAYHDAGATNEYVPLFEQAWQIATNAFGESNAHTLIALADLGVAYRDSGRRAESIRLLEHGVQVSRQTHGEMDLRTLYVVNALAWSYHVDGQSERAVPLLEQTLAGRERALGRDHEETTRAMIDLAGAYLAVGRKDAGFAMLKEGYEIRRRAQGPQHHATLLAIDVLARSCERDGRTNEALTWHTLALQLREAKLGPDHLLGPRQPSTVRTRNDVLRLRAAMGGITNQLPR
jgi:hypothetical protein